MVSDAWHLEAWDQSSGIRDCALEENFDLDVMATSWRHSSEPIFGYVLPMTSILGDYAMWEIRINQCFQIQEIMLYGSIGLVRDMQATKKTQEGSVITIVLKTCSASCSDSLDSNLLNRLQRTYGAGFDWSDMAEEEIQANMALMAFSDSEVKNDKSCSKNCLKNYEALKKQYDDLLVKLSDTDFKAATYKRDVMVAKEYQMDYFRVVNLKKLKKKKRVELD
ncbi:hypothetical protein Tco_0586460 [Tanacetum coccineum]|uniref:Uncharacterized protein n=1 Tax=Tanacetum coccineum TaxID=301880 RepID=A0ABQ5FBG7_9ASTR